MTHNSKPAECRVPLDWFKPRVAEQSMLGQLLEDLRIDGRNEGTDGQTKENEKKIGFAHGAGEHKAAVIIPSGSDPLPACCRRCSSTYSLLSRSEPNSRSSLVLHSSDTGDVLSEGSVVSDRAWQLDGVSGR